MFLFIIFNCLLFSSFIFFPWLSVQGTGEGKRALYHCNYCNKDITGRMRIKCAVCSDFDLCIECFSVGAEVHPHKSSHPYRVMVSNFNVKSDLIQILFCTSLCLYICLNLFVMRTMWKVYTLTDINYGGCCNGSGQIFHKVWMFTSHIIILDNAVS